MSWSLEPRLNVESGLLSKSDQGHAGVISKIHRMNRRITPKLEDRDEQSERKLMYVAMTRAEDCLAVSYSEQSAYVDETGCG